MQGEVNGKKMSADQVEKLSRKQLTISEYITSKQIKSLFSRWSRLLREGKLKEPSEKEVDVKSEEDENDDDDAEQYHYVFNVGPKIVGLQ